MKRLILFAVLALVVAACGGSAVSDQSTDPTDPASTETTSTSDTPATTGSDGETTTTPAGETSTTSGREVAPDFTLQLGEGGTFSLSDSSKPVYLVFWAEW